MNGAESLLQTAVDAGVEVCFANPGTTEMPLVAALDRIQGIRSILGVFEGVCTGAADGYGRMTGRPALTLLHLGPGFANGIANLHNARRARSPIVNLIGDHASWHREADAPLTSDIHSLATPVSTWVRTTRSAASAAEDTAAAIEAATGPPGGVSTVIVPADHQWEAAGGPVRVKLPQPRANVSDERIESVAARLRGATRPLLLLGGHALTGAGQRAAARVAQTLGATVYVETFPARWERGLGLPAFERLPYFPEQAIDALEGSTAVVTAGARDPVAFFGYPEIPSRLAPPEASLSLADPEQDAEHALEALAEALGCAPLRLSPAPPATPPPDGAALDPATIGAVLASRLPENAIVSEEAATSSLPFYGVSTGAPPHTLLSLTGGAIGQGLPCATGAAVACPDRPVIAFQADGSGLYTAQALWTQAREGLRVITLLCSNRAYRILQVELARAGVAEAGPAARSLMSLEEPAIDWVSLARGFGVPASRVETSDALGTALDRALAAEGPVLIELAMG